MEIPASLTVNQLAALLHAGQVDIIKQLMRQGVMVNVNQTVDFATAAAVAQSYGVPVREKVAEAPAVGQGPEFEMGQALPRPPVVTILGHVDHGKTTLLDAIRQTNVVATEAGEITQHIGAYQVEVDGKKITFLDTPGHEAFTAMRARGARITDIAVLVIAADDGVMPQTIEAIDHAKAAGVPIVVAINKIDRPEADVDRVKRQLTEHGLVIEEWGGDVICASVSAKQKEGIPQLLEYLLLVAEMAELKADPAQPAAGVVVEAALDKTRGPVATLLVNNGTLSVGDIAVAGYAWGRIKAMFDDQGQRIKQAGPSTPVEVMGLSSPPRPGDTFTIAENERQARSLAASHQVRRADESGRLATLDTIYSQISDGRVQELNVILKADVQGSIEPIRTSLEHLSSERIKVRVIHTGTGSITESDVMLAMASKGIVLGFNTRPEPGARKLADAEGVDIRFYNIIYTLTDAVQKALVGMLEPVYAEVIEGRAEVIAIFSAGVGVKRVAGVKVTSGKVSMGAQARVIRKGEVVADSHVKSLRRFQDKANEASEGMEAGVGIEGFWNFAVGDQIECYRRERVD
ncbi:MAG: translation initiation factor IF-2 [Dehalococcoidia bacterium]